MRNLTTTHELYPLFSLNETMKNNSNDNYHTVSYGDVTDRYVCTMTSQRCWWRQLHLRPPGNRRLPSLQCRGVLWTGEISDVRETVFVRPKPRPEDNNTGNRRKDESCPSCWTKDVQSTRTTPSWAGHVVAEPHRCHGNELSQQHQHYDSINDAGYFRC